MDVWFVSWDFPGKESPGTGGEAVMPVAVGCSGLALTRLPRTPSWPGPWPHELHRSGDTHGLLHGGPPRAGGPRSCSPVLSVPSPAPLSAPSSVHCASLSLFLCLCLLLCRLLPLPLCSSLCPSASAFFCSCLSLPLPMCALVSVCLPVSCLCLNLCLQLARSVSAFPAPSHVFSSREHSRCCVAWRSSLSVTSVLTNIPLPLPRPTGVVCPGPP